MGNWGRGRHWQGCGGPWGRRGHAPRGPLGPFGLDPGAFKHMESELNANTNLMDLGNMVRAALDPFGVDVHVDVETPGGEKKCMNKKKSCGGRLLSKLRRHLSQLKNQLNKLRNQLSMLRNLMRNQLKL